MRLVNIRAHYTRWKAGSVLIVVLLALPIPKVFVEDWSVRVTDLTGLPAANIRVSRGWENYTFSLSDGSEMYTDSEGYVAFPKQMRIRPICYWLAKATWTLLNLGVHTSLGTVASVRVSDPEREWTLDPTGHWPASANCVDANCTSSKLRSQLRILLAEVR